jgi:hypothetical protein
MSRFTRPSTAGAFGLALAVTLGACSRGETNKMQTSPGAIADTMAPAAAVITADTTAGELKVTAIVLGTKAAPNNMVANETDHFKPRQEIYAAVTANGTKPGTITARFMNDSGKVVQERTTTISPNGQVNTQIHANNPGGWPKGTYTLHVMFNGREVGTKQFTVE